jgi:hypothetical protein
MAMLHQLQFETIIRAKGLVIARKCFIMVDDPVVKTPPPTQHISFEDEEAQIVNLFENPIRI